MYLVGIIIMFGILIVLGTQFLSKRNNPAAIPLNLTKPDITVNLEKTYLAKIDTNLGVFTIELCTKCAPQNVNNFIYLSNKKYYNSTKIHRIITDLLFQAGDRNTLGSDITNYGKGKTTYLINDEVNWDSLNLPQEKRELLTKKGYSPAIGLNSKTLSKYTVAMANDGPNTNSSQFFVVTGDNSDSRIQDLNGFFTVIGEVKSGFEVLEKINSVTVMQGSSLPATEIIIQNIEISEI
jgi:cyclophilin family peptidyl-prolyl cis-trans isomerase